MSLTMHPQVVTDLYVSSAPDCFAITKHDTTNFAYQVRGIYVGGTGDVTVVTPEGSVVTFPGVPAGTILPVRATRVNETGTDASDMVGLY
jgi:hypothetical protein